jgi:hypothetical protein
MTDNLTMLGFLDFIDFIFNLQVNAGIKYKKWQFLIENQEDNFDERYHLSDRFEVFI